MKLRSFELVIKAKVPDDMNEEDVLGIIKGMITENTGCSVTSIAGIRAPYDNPGVVLDRESARVALLSRMSEDGMSIQDSAELRVRVEDFYHFLEDALSGWIDDQYRIFAEEAERK
jgi:hypothetical protein